MLDGEPHDKRLTLCCTICLSLPAYTCQAYNSFNTICLSLQAYTYQVYYSFYTVCLSSPAYTCQVYNSFYTICLSLPAYTYQAYYSFYTGAVHRPSLMYGKHFTLGRANIFFFWNNLWFYPVFNLDIHILSCFVYKRFSGPYDIYFQCLHGQLTLFTFVSENTALS